MILPNIHEIWFPASGASVLFIELLVGMKYELLVWLPSGFVGKVGI